MNDEKQMTIREMCDAFDVTPRTLRFYEAKELLFPRREGQKRLFTRRDRARLKLILRGKSDRLVYIYIHDDQVEIRDASHLQGKGSGETAKLLRAELEAEILGCELHWADEVPPAVVTLQPL